MTSVKLRNIIFIHGLADVSKSWHRLRPFLESCGFQIYFYDYPTLKNNLDIPRIVDGLIKFVREHVGEEPFQILAHSQGGLIAEWYDFFHNAKKQLKRVTAIATPFQGNSLPLFGKKLLEHIPFSRKQILGLSCFSPILKALIQQRLAVEANSTPYFSFIGYRKKLFDIEGDLVVAACEANRNAVYYKITGREFRPVSAQTITPFRILKKNHLPLNYIRHLQSEQNIFADRLISALNGNFVESDSTEGLSQFAVVLPNHLEPEVKFHDGISKIVSRTTADENYRLIYGTIFGKNESHLDINSQAIQIKTGLFTYIM